MKEHCESDLNVASFLLAKGVDLLGLRLDGRGRYAFRFANDDHRATDAAVAFVRGDVVSAKALIAAQRDLKGLIYSRTREDGDEHGNARNRDSF